MKSIYLNLFIINAVWTYRWSYHWDRIMKLVLQSNKSHIYTHKYIYTSTHTHTYIYIYRERERKSEWDWEWVRNTDIMIKGERDRETERERKRQKEKNSGDGQCILWTRLISTYAAYDDKNDNWFCCRNNSRLFSALFRLQKIGRLSDLWSSWKSALRTAKTKIKFF